MQAVLDRLVRGTRRARSPACAALAGLALALHCAPAATRSVPEHFGARFVLSAKGFDVAETQLRLTPSGSGRYVYESMTEAVGVAKLFRDERVEERSEWRLGEHGEVEPLRYVYSRTGGRRLREAEVRFDWEDGRIRNTLNGESWTMPLAHGTLDKLVYVFALMRDLEGGMRGEMRYPVADGGKVKTYRVKVVGEERIDTVLGPLDTIVVERSQKGSERLTLVWCAPSLRFMPVQMEHREDGEVARLTLKSLEGLDPAAP